MREEGETDDGRRARQMQGGGESARGRLPTKRNMREMYEGRVGWACA